MTKLLSLCCGLALIFMTTACDRQSSETTESTTAAPQTEKAHNGETTAALPEPAVRKGKVVESMNAAGYTYILVDDGTEQKWIATMAAEVKEGEEISYYDGAVMENWTSKTLNRTFDKVVFSNGLVGKMPIQHGASPVMGQEKADSDTETGQSFTDALKTELSGGAGGQGTIPGAGSGKALVPFTEVKVEKAGGENGHTIAEIFAKAAELNGKKVAVRGKVTKVSRRIMGLNWLHIQDGTGKAEDKTYELVITTKAEPPEKGAIITANGVLGANRDLGFGYFYAAILEKAELSE